MRLILSVCEAVLLELCWGHSLLLATAVRQYAAGNCASILLVTLRAVWCGAALPPNPARPANGSPIRGRARRLAPERRPRRNQAPAASATQVYVFTSSSCSRVVFVFKLLNSIAIHFFSPENMLRLIGAVRTVGSSNGHTSWHALLL